LSGELREYLESKKSGIYKEWLERFWRSFGKESEKFFKREVDRFQNPFGYRVEETFQGLIDVIFGDFDWEKANYFLDRLVQLRAIQETEPSKALHLFFLLKEIIREDFGEDFIEKFGIFEYLRLEDKIDILLLKAMDYFLSYRERLYQIRYDEWKRNRFLLLKKAGIIYDPVEGSPIPVEREKIAGGKN